jgi:hypothetical protein
MSIVPVGLILLPLGPLLFVWGRRALLWATIASIPFFLVVLIELPFAPIRAFQYFGGLLIVRHFFDRCIQGRLRFQKSYATLTALLFVVTVSVSIFMPALITQPVYVAPEGIPSVADAYANMVELEFDLSNLTQILYPVFGTLLFFVLQANLRREEDLRRLIQVFLVAFVGLIVFSAVYIALDLVGGGAIMDFIFTLFSNKEDASYSSYNALGGIVRAYTPAGEPGYTGVYYIIILSLLFGLKFGGYTGGWKPRGMYFLLILSFVGIITNASTTAYFGVVCLVLSFLMIAFLRKSRGMTSDRSTKIVFRFAVVSAIGGAGAFVVLQAAGISVAQYLFEQHIAKLTEEAGSGAIRLLSVQYSLNEVFSASPLLGVGYGSHRALSLLVYLPANIGVIGFGTFLLFNGVVFGRAIRVVNYSSSSELASIAFACAVAQSTLLATLLVAKSETSLSFGWLWAILAVMEATRRIHERRERAITS